MQKPTPPRWADRLLELFVAPHLLEDVQGDLHEVFYKQLAEFGVGKARRQFVWAVFNYLTPFFFRRKPSGFPSSPFLSFGMLRNYLTIAFRTLAQSKAYSIINVVGLSIGLATAMLILLYTKDEASYDQFHANNPNIYRIVFDNFAPNGTLEQHQGNSGYVQGPKFATGIPEIQSFVRYKQHQIDLKQGTEVKNQTVYQVDPDFFSVFTFPLLSGNPKTALQDPNSIVLSAEMAEKQFGTTDAVGKTIFLKDVFDSNKPFEPYTVTGVAQNSPQNSSIKFEVMMPLVVKKEILDEPMNWMNSMLNTFVVVRPDATIQNVEAKMNRLFRAETKGVFVEMAKKFDYHNTRVYGLQPFTAMHLSKDLPANNGLMDRSNPLFSYILSGIALFILLIACINFVNLTVARSLKRAKEIGVRKVVGGGRTQLIFQFLGESFVLCFAAFAFALLLVQVTLPTFSQLANKALSLTYLIDFGLVVGYFLLFAVTGLLAGFYPALVLSNYSPVQTLYSRFKLSGKNYLQKSLVVMQFAIASFLIIGTLTIYSQFNYLITKDLGYDDKQVISIDKWNLTRPELQLLKEELLQSPTIVAVAAKNAGQNGTGAKVNGETQIDFNYETIDGAYLPLLSIPILKGRNFSPSFPSDSTKSVLVNETFVKKAGWKKSIGQIVDFWYEEGQKYQVIGVVRDYHFRDLNREIGPQVFTMKPGNTYGKAFLKIKPNTETASLNHLKKTFKKLFPLNPYSYKFMDEENQKRYESEAKWKQIMLFGAILTIFISCIGLFGLATLSAERRTKEIGIRKVLGASVSSIVQLLSSDFLKLVGLSFVFAFPAAYYVIDQWLQNYPYRIHMGFEIFALAAMLAILIAFFTVSFQSIRAAVSNPVKSLRSE